MARWTNDSPKSRHWRRGDISPTNIAHANIDSEEEGLDGNTNETITMIGDDDVSDGEDISDRDDDDDNDEMMDAAEDHGDGTVEGLATSVAQLSIPDLLENFEDSIEWGGYDYDYMAARS